MSIRTLIFDFGNVLGFFCRKRAAEQLARFGPPAAADPLLRFLSSAEQETRFELGQMTSTQMLELLRREFTLAGSDDDLAHAYGDMFTPNPAVCTLLPHLKERYRLLLLSNTNDLHYRVFRRQFADSLAHFDRLVLSHEVGLRKPDPGIYAHAQQHTSCSPSECLFIDDLPANIAAGQALGWRTIRYQGGDLAGPLRQAGIDFPARLA